MTTTKYISTYAKTRHAGITTNYTRRNRITGFTQKDESGDSSFFHCFIGLLYKIVDSNFILKNHTVMITEQSSQETA